METITKRLNQFGFLEKKRNYFIYSLSSEVQCCLFIKQYKKKLLPKIEIGLGFYFPDIGDMLIDRLYKIAGHRVYPSITVDLLSVVPQKLWDEIPSNPHNLVLYDASCIPLLVTEYIQPFIEPFKKKKYAIDYLMRHRDYLLLDMTMVIMSYEWNADISSPLQIIQENKEYWIRQVDESANESREKFATVQNWDYINSIGGPFPLSNYLMWNEFERDTKGLMENSLPICHQLNRRASPAKIGDVYCTTYKGIKKYFQYLGIDDNCLGGRSIRVFKEEYPTGTGPDVEDIVSGEVDFYTHTMICLWEREGHWNKVGNSKKTGDTGAKVGIRFDSDSNAIIPASRIIRRMFKIDDSEVISCMDWILTR